MPQSELWEMYVSWKKTPQPQNQTALKKPDYHHKIKKHHHKKKTQNKTYWCEDLRILFFV